MFNSIYHKMMKKYRLFKFAPILLCIITLSIAVSCQEENNSAFVPYRVVIGGPDKVIPGEMAVYYTDAYGDETFNWSVPAGATIMNGAGTNSIIVSFEAGSSGDINIQARGLDGKKTVTVEAIAPVVDSLKLDSDIVALRQGATANVTMYFNAEFATDPEVLLVSPGGVTGGTLGALEKVDAKTYQISYTAGAGDGKEKISVDNAVSTAYYGSLAMDTVATFDIYTVDNTPATGRLFASSTPVYDSGSVVTLSAVFSEKLSPETPVQISVGGFATAYVTNAAMASTDSTTWTYDFQSDGTINELVTVSVSNLPPDLVGNPTEAVEPIIIEIKNE